MPLKPREMEKIILADGWIFKNQEGSHRNYIHPIKPGKVTIPFHQGRDLNKKTENSIKKQAGLKYPHYLPIHKTGGVIICYQCTQLAFFMKMAVTL